MHSKPSLPLQSVWLYGIHTASRRPGALWSSIWSVRLFAHRELYAPSGHYRQGGCTIAQRRERREHDSDESEEQIRSGSCRRRTPPQVNLASYKAFSCVQLRSAGFSGLQLCLAAFSCVQQRSAAFSGVQRLRSTAFSGQRQCVRA